MQERRVPFSRGTKKRQAEARNACHWSGAVTLRCVSRYSSVKERYRFFSFGDAMFIK